MSLRTEQLWYSRVAHAEPPPDLVPLTLEEARVELALSPFQDPLDFNDLARYDTETRLGMTRVLLQAMEQGSQQALGLLLERCQPRIRAMVRSQLGQPLRTYLDSGEVQQEVNLQLMRSIQSFVPQSDGAFVAWLYAIIRNRIHALHKRANARPIQHAPTSELDTLPDEHDDATARHKLLEKALERLDEESPDHARALRLQLGGWSIRRIAADLERSEAATGMLLVRARQRLAPIVHRMKEG